MNADLQNTIGWGSQNRFESTRATSFSLNQLFYLVFSFSPGSLLPKSPRTPQTEQRTRRRISAMSARSPRSTTRNVVWNLVERVAYCLAEVETLKMAGAYAQKQGGHCTQRACMATYSKPHATVQPRHHDKQEIGAPAVFFGFSSDVKILFSLDRFKACYVAREIPEG